MATAGHQKITTFLMFEGSAGEAMEFYTSLFDDGEIVAVSRYGVSEEGTEGTVRHAVFRIAGQEFMCIDSAVSHTFTFTPSVSLYVRCANEEEIERLHTRLSAGGQELMPLGSYGFSTRFGWVNDRFGVSWQIDLH